MSLACPQCSAPSRVIDSREQPGGAIYRRRLCTSGHRWSTYELHEVEYVQLRQAIAITRDLHAKLEAVLKRFPSLTRGD